MVLQHYVIGTTALVMGVVGIISLVALVFIGIFFGRLIKHQSKIFLLAKRGYTQIRHIKEDMTEKYFFLRIRDDHFSFDDGIYLEQKDTRTKVNSILAPYDVALLSKKADNDCTPEEKEIKLFLKGMKDFLKNVKDSKTMDITTLSWGIPTITYYANIPNPVNVKDMKKVYDAKNISAMIKRILMTKEWKLVRMVLILCGIIMICLVILGFVDYAVANKNAGNLGSCLTQLNITTSKYTELLNTTRVYNVLANNTITI